MRTTITFDAEAAAVVEQFRRERGVGVSAAVNELIRRSATRPAARRPFVQQTSSGGAKMDMTNIAEVLELLEGPAAR